MCCLVKSRRSYSSFALNPLLPFRHSQASELNALLFLQPPWLLLGDQRVCKHLSDGSHNQSLKHRGCWWRGKRPALHYNFYLSPATTYSFRPCWGDGGVHSWGVVGWGIAISDSLIGRCLELSGVRTVNPSGNTSWLTWVNLALYVSVTPCWWKNRGAIKQRQTIWVCYGQPWGVERTLGKWGWCSCSAPFLFLLFCALLALFKSAHMLKGWLLITQRCRTEWSKQGFKNVWNVSKSMGKNNLYLDVPKTIFYCCKETRCCCGTQYVCQSCGLSDNNACVNVSDCKKNPSSKIRHYGFAD